jgi:dCMP deaminase
MIDEGFKKSFYMNAPIHEDDITFELNKYIEMYKDNINSILYNIHNMVVVCSAIGYTYNHIVNKIYDKIDITTIELADLDKIIVLYVTKYAVENKIPGINKYVRFKRDIDKEVAAIKFNVLEQDVTEDMKKLINKISDKSSYGIEGESINNWDEYFYNVSITVGRNSKCLSRKIGSVLVKDKSIISTGYNGPPRGIPSCDRRWKLDKEFKEKYNKIKFNKPECPRKSIGFKSGEGLEVCIAGHAERNALINAARNGICTMNTTLYMSCGIPCSACLVEIINAGVEGIVVTSMKTYDNSAMYLLKNSDLKIRLYNFL